MSGVWLVHPSGNQNVRQTALALAESGRLDRFWTGIRWPTRSTLGSLLPSNLRRELERRSFPAAIEPFIRTHPWREAARVAMERFPGRPARHFGALSAHACYAGLSRHVARRLERAPDAPAAVYAYDDCALECFDIAGRRGIRRIYDLPAPYWRERALIMSEAVERYPDWQNSVEQTTFDAPAYARKDAELARADSVVVASGFAARALVRHHPQLADRIEMIRYGAPTVGPRRIPPSNDGRLRLLFVGRLTLAKGAAAVAQAAAALGRQVEFTVVGGRAAANARLDAFLEASRWIPSIPHDGLIELMREHDILVFPSLFEGYGLVVTEAMSQGCVVITTDRTIGGDIIESGSNGILVKPHSADAIVEAVTRLDADRDLLAQMAAAGQRWCAANDWSTYRAALNSAIDKLVAPTCAPSAVPRGSA